jgi:hypothetical protein
MGCGASRLLLAGSFALGFRRLLAIGEGGQFVPKSKPFRAQNQKCVEEPDELLKISHLKSDRMPDPDEYMKN